MQTNEQHLETRAKRRVAAEDRYLDRLEARVEAAYHLIGTLCREGKTVYYINLRPMRCGKIKESTSSALLCDYLLRNNYV
jgi:hypothetical protein